MPIRLRFQICPTLWDVLMGICDSKKRFIDVFTGVPGKIHDSRVLKLSDIGQELPELLGRSYHLLGDGAYSIREWLLIPFKNYGTLTAAEREYNNRFCATRVLIENTFGLLKRRWRQLLEIDMHKVEKISKFIISGCVLHNLCIDNEDIYIYDEAYEEMNDVELAEVVEINEEELKRLGEERRNAIKDSFLFNEDENN
ncbi:putative nuclease HARBI1 [Diprion similis]|uniref:putative nuclease HARBI1 n=1 Tax=Diprion similis TaxID=362088 RepID=UPI001EF79D2C|nr:putative nuclease HARBI1 [Diprion similis]